ncbi:hypothetical protein L484_009747 [Morus notabilis]|uniref:Uncharacterized protein n=1 Tax=Morus notabilis TaxID=981085 RepID=W9QME5_9ROSA|nr:hypothetical protein L484_009747 [Morus notabilis]
METNTQIYFDEWDKAQRTKPGVLHQILCQKLTLSNQIDKSSTKLLLRLLFMGSRVRRVAKCRHRRTPALKGNAQKNLIPLKRMREREEEKNSSY